MKREERGLKKEERDDGDEFKMQVRFFLARVLLYCRFILQLNFRIETLTTSEKFDYHGNFATSCNCLTCKVDNVSYKSPK